MPKPPDLLSSHQVAQLLEMNPASVVRWVNCGKLKAYRTPGGHHRIGVRDLVEFLRASGMRVPAALVSTRRILVVDDRPHHLEVARDALAGVEGLEVEACSSGIRALMKIGAERPAAVVLSSQLRDLDALAVLRELRAELEAGETAVVITAREPTSDFTIQAQVLGASAVVAFPQQASNLGPLLSRVAARNADGRQRRPRASGDVAR